jgi:ABC-type polar amino acid transport system ATPase subunit
MQEASTNTATSKKDFSEHMIELSGVNKWYGDFHVLKDINLNVGKGEIVVVAGPSGSASQP